MKLLSLNCQKAYQPGLESFLKQILEEERYDFLLLQEVNEAVLGFLERSTSYRFLTATYTDSGLPSHLCIGYRSSADLVSRELHSFAGVHYDPVRGYKHSSFGLLSARFNFREEEVCVGSIHLHSGIDAKVRVRELQKAKEIGLRFAGHSPIIFGGDFNLGYPGELSRACRVLAPEFSCATRTLGGTLDSRYSEYANHLPNKIAVALAKVGIGVKLKADHFFVNARFASTERISVRMLPDRVSDHSPVELTSETIAK